jgi:hypothetical protein
LDILGIRSIRQNKAAMKPSERALVALLLGWLT